MDQKIGNLTLNMHIDQLCELYEKEKFLTVIQKTKKLLIKFNDSISLLNILGMSNSKIKKYDTAINYYQEALKINPNHPLTLFHLGVVFRIYLILTILLSIMKKLLKVSLIILILYLIYHLYTKI